MKKIVLLISFLMAALFSANYVLAQKIEPKTLTLSSGEGPLSNGLFFEASFVRGTDQINVSLGERDMYFVYLKDCGQKIFIGPSFEYYYNVPLLGIMALTTPFSNQDFSINTMTWSGVSAGRPTEKVELLRWRILFFWQSLDITYKKFTLTGAIMYYDTWGPLIDLKYKQPLTEHFALFGSAGYSFYQDEKALLKLGLNYSL